MTGILIEDIEEFYGHMHLSTKMFICVNKKLSKNAERNLLKEHLKMLMSKYRYAKRQFTEKYLQSACANSAIQYVQRVVSKYVHT